MGNYAYLPEPPETNYSVALKSFSFALRNVANQTDILHVLEMMTQMNGNYITKYVIILFYQHKFDFKKTSARVC